MDEHTEQLKLHNRDAEESFLGSVLLDPDCADEYPLSPDDFYIVRNGWVWDAVLHLKQKHAAVDVVTVADRLDEANHLQEAGGEAYLAKLTAGTFTTLHVGEYASIISDLSHRRRMLRLANDAAKAAYDRSQPISDTAASIMDGLGKISVPERGAVHWSQYTSQVYDEVLERSQNPQDVWGIPTGFKDIDVFLGGLQRSEVWYIAGEPGIGKSKLMLQVAVNMAEHAPGAIFSLEMKASAMARRGLSLLSKVPTRNMKSGRVEDGEWDRLTKALQESVDLPVYIRDRSLNVMELRADLTRLKHKFDIQWFALDYLLLLDGYERQDETERSSSLSRQVKMIANDLDLAGISVNTVTKEQFDSSKVSNRNVRGSGQVVHDADLIAFLTDHVPSPMEKKNPSLATLTFTKTRDVDMGCRSLDLYVHHDYPGFSDVEARMAENVAMLDWWNQ